MAAGTSNTLKRVMLATASAHAAAGAPPYTVSDVPGGHICVKLSASSNDPLTPRLSPAATLAAPSASEYAYSWLQVTVTVAHTPPRPAGSAALTRVPAKAARVSVGGVNA